MTTLSDGKVAILRPMSGYDTAEGYRAEPFDDRDDEDPEYTIDPMFSGTHADGGRHRKLRHKDLEAFPKSPGELATMNPEAEYEA